MSRPFIEEITRTGATSHNAIAARLNERNVRTARGVRSSGDWRLKPEPHPNGRKRYKRMTLAPHEFIRRFLMHVLPGGFHRIRRITSEISDLFRIVKIYP
jgi:hypothetical protein